MGGTTKIEQPAQPAAPTLSSSIAEYVQTQPQLFALQQQQAPQEAAQQLALLQEFGPQFGQAIKSAQEALYPETSALQESLAGQAAEGMGSGLSPAREAQLKSDIRANLGTNVGSEIGAFSFGRQMDIYREQEKDKYRNLALSLAGRQQLATPQAPSYTNQLAGFTPSQALGFNQGVYGTQAGIYGTQSNFALGLGQLANQQRGQNFDLGANIFRGFMGV